MEDWGETPTCSSWPIRSVANFPQCEINCIFFVWILMIKERKKERKKRNISNAIWKMRRLGLGSLKANGTRWRMCRGMGYRCATGHLWFPWQLVVGGASLGSSTPTLRISFGFHLFGQTFLFVIRALKCRLMGNWNVNFVEKTPGYVLSVVSGLMGVCEVSYEPSKRSGVRQSRIGCIGLPNLVSMFQCWQPDLLILNKYRLLFIITDENECYRWNWVRQPGLSWEK